MLSLFRSNLREGDWTFFIVFGFVIVVLIFSYLLSLQLPPDLYSHQQDDGKEQTTKNTQEDEKASNEKRYNLNYQPSNFNLELTGGQKPDPKKRDLWTALNCFRNLELGLKKSSTGAVVVSGGPEFEEFMYKISYGEYSREHNHYMKTNDNKDQQEKNKNWRNEQYQKKEKNEEEEKDKEEEDVNSLLKYSCHKHRCILKSVDLYTDTSINIIMHIPPVDSIPPIAPSFEGHLPCLNEFSKRQGKVVRFIVSDEPFDYQKRDCSSAIQQDVPVYLSSSIYGNNAFHMIYDVLLPLVNTILVDRFSIDTSNQILIDYAREDKVSPDSAGRELLQLFSDYPVKTVQEAIHSNNRICINDFRLGLESSFSMCSHSTRAPFSYCYHLLRTFVYHVKSKLQLLTNIPYDEVQITYVKRRQNRKIVNEDQMMDAFQTLAEKMGGKAKEVYLSEMNLSEQVKVMHETTVLVGVHSDDLTHTVWMREGTAAIVVYPHGCHNYVYNHMMKLRNITDFMYKCSPEDTQFSSLWKRRRAMENGWPDEDVLQEQLGSCSEAVRNNDVHVNTDSMQLAVKKAIESVLFWAEKHNQLR